MDRRKKTPPNYRTSDEGVRISSPQPCTRSPTYEKIRRVSYPRGSRGKAMRLSILKKSRHMRRWFVRNPWTRPICVFNYAALKIQQTVRGFLLRLQKQKLGSSFGWKSIRRSWGQNIVHKPNPMKKQQQPNRAVGSWTGRQIQLDKYLSYTDSFMRRPGAIRPVWLEGGYSAWCSVRIQSWWRMIPKRRRFLYRRRLINQIAAIVIQSAWRALIFRRERKRIEFSAHATVSMKHKAALKIQMCWRSFCNCRIFKYFSDLVKVKLKGAPADLLRSIIPQEADYLERGSGVHVRFRLGGSVFPPKVYFKIFTHRPLCDLNAFAPRDYVQEKLIDVYQVHNKSGNYNPSTSTALKNKISSIRVGARYFDVNVTTTAGIESWYKRDERNPWRPISSHLFEDILVPPWLRDVPHSKKPEHFHFSRMKRIEIEKKERLRKQKEWMAKAFLMARGEDITKAKVQRRIDELLTSTDVNKSHGHTKTPKLANASSVDALTGDNGYAKKINYPDYKTINVQEFENDITFPSLPHNPTLDIDTTNEIDLLKWSMALNFDDYKLAWKSTAISVSSDKQVY